MKIIFNVVATGVLSISCSCGSVYGFGFHGGGGGFHGGDFGGGLGGGGFDRGGFGSGSLGNGGIGGFHPQLGGSFDRSGGLPSSLRAPTGGASFDHAGVPSFGGYGSGGYGGYGSFHPQSYNPGGFASNSAGARRGEASQPSLSAFGGSGGAAWDHNSYASLTGGGFGERVEGIRAGGGEFSGARPTPAELNQFLGLKSSDLAELKKFQFPTGHAGNAPSWQSMQAPALSQAHSRVQNAIRPTGNAASKANNWLTSHPDRAKEWSDFGDKVRQGWNDHNHPGANWWSQNHPNDPVRPGSDWWSKYHPNLAPWYYHHGWYNHPWQYWWNPASVNDVDAWLTAWGLAGAPMYYDYGTGGNVVYQNNDVYVNGQDVGSDSEYAQTAGDIATVPASETPALPESNASTPAENNQAAQDQWLPLGTYGVVTSEHETDPTRMLQLAVDKQGVISGTLYNTSTNQSYVVQGRVDKKTQRVAMTFGDKLDAVLETGIYNLTQPQTEALVHYGPTKTQKLFLVRLDAPKDQPAGATGASTPVQNGAPVQ